MLFTTKYTAKFLGITPGRVRQLIKIEKLKAVKIGRDWMVNDKDLEVFKLPKRGRPFKHQHEKCSNRCLNDNDKCCYE